MTQDSVAIRTPRCSRPYADRPLYFLIERIVETGDLDAMSELHNERRIFRDGEGPHRLVDFVERLSRGKEAWECAGRDPVVLDQGKCHVIDKFLNLPGNGEGALVSEAAHARSRSRNGTDARFYFRAVLLKVKRVTTEHPELTDLDKEQSTERELSGLVRRHLLRSCQECWRRLNGLVTRYTYKDAGGSLRLWMPVEIAGSARRKWLHRTIGPIHPSAPGERARVQELINSRVAVRRVVPLSADAVESSAEMPGPGLPWSLEYGVSVLGIAEAVAEEKAANIHLVRRAIARLGRQRLRLMIRKIFNDLADGSFCSAEIARAYGLNESAFSRFAGPRWRKGSSDNIPDLYRNTAQVLAHHPHFEEAARAAGVWDDVAEIVQQGEESAQR